MSEWVCAINGGDEEFVRSMLAVDLQENQSVKTAGQAGIAFAFTELKCEADPCQFFETSDGFSVLFQGSLTNASKLRQGVKPKPKDNSDASLIVALYKMKGRKLMHYLEGSFCFVLREKNHFFAARDPIGVKPLYYGRLNDSWLFATELKSFPANVQRIAEFPPGCYWESESGARRYYKLPDEPAEQVSLQEGMEVVRALVNDSVQKVAKSDLEIGVYLSGSVESCIVAALVAQKKSKLRTFSVGLQDSSDGQTAKKVASWLGTEHTHFEISQEEMLANLQTVIYKLESFDAPIVRQAVADYFAVRIAAQDVKVLLSGDGANELFGGHAYLRPMFREKLATELKQITDDLHKTQLHRWHRLTNCFGIEGRTPFSDRRMVHAIMRFPVGLKVNDDGRGKWVLRRAFSTVLPAWVVDRPDSEDTHSASLQQALIAYADTVFTDDDLSAHNDGGGILLRTKDEMLYHQIWSSKFPEHIAALVGRTHL